MELAQHIPIIEKGYLGVDMFFILSGFILAYVYANAQQTKFSYKRFLKARVARIYPLHFFALCSLGLIVVFLPHFADQNTKLTQRWGVDAFIASLLLIQNWAYFLPTCWNVPSWSLSAEWFAYLTFPVFLKATQWPKSAAIPLILATGSLLILPIALVLHGTYELSAAGTPGMLRMACEFAAGCFLLKAVTNGLPHLPRVVELLILGFFVIGVLLHGTESVALLMFGLIILSARNNGWISRFLSLRFIVFLGEISYSVYLLHWIIIQIANWVGTPTSWIRVPRDLGLVLIIIALASLSYRYIERPARAWGRTVR